MLLRRAPREVYRVYGEEEFFATAADERSEPTDGAGEQRLQRVAGATVLLAAAGAVGGLIAITSLSTAAGARPAGGRICSRPCARRTTREPRARGSGASRRALTEPIGRVCSRGVTASAPLASAA